MSTREVTLDGFEQLVTKPGIVFLDFWAEWCGPCRMFAPIFEAASNKHPDIVFGKVDTEAQPELAQAFGIRSIPTLMAFRDGVPVFFQPGMLPAKVLEELIGKVRGLDMEDVKKKLAARQAAAPTS